MLTDEIVDKPTKKNILEALSRLFEGAKANDSLFLHCTFRPSFLLVSNTFNYAQTLGTVARPPIRMAMRSTEKMKVFPLHFFLLRVGQTADNPYS